MSKFWERKMKTYFNRVDIDGDGVITDKDFDMLMIKYADENRADSKRKEKLVQLIRDFWKNLTKAIRADGRQKLTFPAFLEAVRSQLDDPEEFKRTSAVLCKDMFDLIDTNDDGYLQEDEFKRFYQGMGIIDIGWTSETFRAIDLNHDNKLSCDEFLHGLHEFVLTDDERNPYTLFLGPLVA